MNYFYYSYLPSNACLLESVIGTYILYIEHHCGSLCSDGIVDIYIYYMLEYHQSSQSLQSFCENKLLLLLLLLLFLLLQ